MANLITIKDTGESPYDYTINGDSIRTIKTYTSEENEGYYICELYTDLGLGDYQFEFQSKDPATLERNITNAILSGSGDGLVPVDTKGVYFYPDAIPVPVSNTLKYTIIAETGSGEYCLPFAWQSMIDEIYNYNQFDERTSTAVVNYNCTVDWGDGSPVETFTTEDVTDYIVHDYGDNETEFTITITGTFEGWAPGLFYEYDDEYYDNGEDIKKILDWGSLKILGPYWFSSMYYAMALAANNPILKLADVPMEIHYDYQTDTYVYAYGKSLESVFRDTQGLLSYGEGGLNPIDISSWDLTGVISLKRMFQYYGTESESTLDVDITQWNTSEVLSMSEMFYYVELNQPIGAWDVSSVVYMREMFYRSEFNQPIGTWDVSNAVDISYMFSYSPFNQDISGWDVSNVTSMNALFYFNQDFNQDISGWDVSNAVNMNTMFHGASSFNQPIGIWNVSNVTNMQNMLNAEGTTMAFDQDISSWDVSSVTNMGGMFYMNTTFDRNINNWDTSSVTNMASMFYGASNFNQPLDNWDVSSVTNMSYMFRNTNSFNQDISGWDVSSVTNMRQMFDSAVVFNQDLSSWNVANVTNSLNFATNTPAWVLPKPSF
jgi:surface protein